MTVGSTNYVQPQLDCVVRLPNGEYQHITVDNLTYTSVPCLKHVYTKKYIKISETIGRVLKLLEPWMVIIVGGSILAPGRLGGRLKVVRAFISPFHLTVKGAQYMFNPLAHTKEPKLVPDWFKLVCPGLMMISGLNGVAVFVRDRLLHLQVPGGVLSAWNTFSYHSKWFGALSAAGFMWTNVGVWKGMIDTLEEATYIGGQSQREEYDRFIQARRKELRGHRIDSVKYMVDFGDAIIPRDAKIYFDALGYFAGVTKSAVDWWTDKDVRTLVSTWRGQDQNQTAVAAA